jgi:hypothetical protein
LGRVVAGDAAESRQFPPLLVRFRSTRVVTAFGGPICRHLSQASPYEIPPLRTDDLLVDRLFEAVKVSLRHAELYLIDSLLPLHSADRGATGKALAWRNRSGWGGIGLHGGRGRWCGGLRESRDRQTKRACQNRGTQKVPHHSPSPANLESKA